MEFEFGKKWLYRARNIELEIKDKIYLIEALYTCCGLQGISYDKVSVISSPENKLERIMADINDAQKELDKLRHQKEPSMRLRRKSRNLIIPRKEQS